MAKLYNLARMTTTTTGTGTITLGSAVAGYLTFAQAGVANGDVVDYAIKDGNDSEIGTGTYTSSGTTLTRTVTKSTNSNAAINLSGAAEVFITPRAETLNDASLLTTGTVGTARLGSGTANSSTVLSGASQWVPAREVLTANRTYYVSTTTGSDSNNGLSAGAPFLTIQKAIDTVAALDISIYNVTIQLADGTYTAGMQVNGPWIGSGTVTVVGNTTTPANVVISTSGKCAYVIGNGSLTISGMKLVSSGDYTLYAVGGGSSIWVGPGVDFGTSGAGHMRADNAAFVTARNNYTISGGGPRHMLAITGGIIEVSGITVTLTGTPAFSAQFANALAGGQISLWSVTYSGSATGSRYSITGNGVINTFGQSTSYLPGNAAGTTATGGQYL